MSKTAPLRNRLFLNYILVVLIAMALATLLAWRAVEGLYIDTQSENLLAQAGLLADSLQGQRLPAGEAQPYLQTANAAPGIHTRLLGESGGVIYSLPVLPSQVAAPPAENSTGVTPAELLRRPEIASAMQGRPATSIRRVASRRVLYAAAPVRSSAGAIAGLVYLATPLPATGLPPAVIWQLAGAVLAALLLALIIGRLLAWQIVSPVEAISLASARVSAGDLSQQVAVGSGIAELDSLAWSFNRMTSSLRESERAKNAFVADITHELRTPLTVIKGTIETLEDGALDDMEGRGPLLASMRRETERLVRMVNDLLLLTRANADALSLDVQPFDLAELGRARCEHFAPLAARSHVQLEVTGSERAGARGDVDRTSQVIDNLLDNAIRYSPAGSTVLVEIATDAHAAHCAVRDCGPGIAATHLPFIFERFYRADASRHRQTGGAGLGLAIARALVLAQGGSISAESEEGRGTTIRFSLPKA